jgi:adenosine deaminase
MIPKAELHCHLEGSITPQMVKRLAKKHGLSIPDTLFNAQGQFQFANFAEFLKVYDVASHVIRSQADYTAITYDYLARAAHEGAIYVELTASPDHAHMNAVSYPDFLAGITEGIEQAKTDFGIEARILMVFVRHLSLDYAHAALEAILQHPHPLVVGVNLAGDEVNFPPRLFSDIFHQAHASGLAGTAHAGEVMGPDSIWEAIDTLPITRIGHGVRAIEDPMLISTLIEKEITLEVCPGSNIALGVYEKFSQHPLKQLFDAGVTVTLNSDDPPFFNTSIGQEYAIAQSHFGLSDNDLRQMTKNSIQAAFLTPAEKVTLIQKL